MRSKKAAENSEAMLSKMLVMGKRRKSEGQILTYLYVSASHRARKWELDKAAKYKWMSGIEEVVWGSISNQEAWGSLGSAANLPWDPREVTWLLCEMRWLVDLDQHFSSFSL